MVSIASRQQAPTPEVEFDNVQLIYESDEGEVEALRGLSFSVQKGKFLSILGPSGCGKSTTLALIAGLRRPTAGVVRTRGSKVGGPTNLVGYVTQQDNLLPWRTVEANIRLPLEVQGVPRRERAARVREMLKLVALEGFERHYPSQ